MPEGSVNLLNSNHERRFGVTCRHLDKLLANMEAALNVSSSELIFPHSAPHAASADRRVIERYASRIRARPMRVLDGEATLRPPEIRVTRSPQSMLNSVAIAAEELKPSYMRAHAEARAESLAVVNAVIGRSTKMAFAAS
jgi:hypothetical protein